MYYTNMHPTDSVTTYLLLAACIAIVALSFMLFRKLASSDTKKMLEAQDFALKNPTKIENLKLVDGSEVFCVATITGKGPIIIANGVQAVRIFDQLVLANPKLAK